MALLDGLLIMRLLQVIVLTLHLNVLCPFILNSGSDCRVTGLCSFKPIAYMLYKELGFAHHSCRKLASFSLEIYCPFYRLFL